MEVQQGLESGVEKLQIASTTNSSVQFFNEFGYMILDEGCYKIEPSKPLALTRFGVNTIALTDPSKGKHEIIICVNAEVCKEPKEKGLKMVHQFKAADDRKIGEEEWILLPYEFVKDKYRYWSLWIPEGAVKLDITFFERDMLYKDKKGVAYGFYLGSSEGVSQGS